MKRHARLTGKRFGRWTVIGFVPDKFRKWKCRCDCGAVKVVFAQHLKSGKSKSCGCLHKEKVTIHGHYKNGIKTPEFEAWRSMIKRCHKKDHPAYHLYGGRGIKVSRHWINSFEAFLEDMGPRPTDKHSLDRINNDEGYNTKNCKWSTKKDQARNKRNNRIIEFRGESHTLVEWSEITGIDAPTISQRLKKGWTVKKALQKFDGRKNKLNGKKINLEKARRIRVLFHLGKTVKELCKEFQISQPMVNKILRNEAWQERKQKSILYFAGQDGVQREIPETVLDGAPVLLSFHTAVTIQQQDRKPKGRLQTLFRARRKVKKRENK